MSMNTNQVLQDVTVEMTAEQEACRKAEKRRFVIAVVIAILGTLTAFSESGDGNARPCGDDDRDIRWHFSFSEESHTVGTLYLR